ncbi:MAG: TIGR00730 family Rossman fold protein [Muribaculaceae bacterium]|nr:TIGR00730 family Rossman fold protein [Muribaculaceae bacterium]
MNLKQAICVYCASSANIAQTYLDAAFSLGKLIASTGKPVVCGAGRTGLMGALIDGAIAQNGQAIGVIPQFMVENGWHHSRLTKMEVTDNMHERKKRMAELSSAVIALPGGCGTLEELLEIITWRQLGLYTGNIVILNTSDYYNPLLQMLDNAISQGFMKKDHSQLWQVATTPEEAIEMALTQENSNFSSKY